MSNFSYLSTRPEYSLFANSAIEAEKVFSTSPAMCAVGCRKALELAVKWVYAADKTITMPYKDNLQSLLHEPSFRFAVDRNVWSVLPSIVKAGNLAVHTGRSVSAADAVFSLRGLFDFIQWVDYCYGTDYVERSFDETAMASTKISLQALKGASKLIFFLLYQGGCTMKVTSKQEAWNKVNEIFPTDYAKDEHSSNRAGYPVYRSTAEGHHCDYICDLGDRLEVNLDSSHLETVNIWIEHPAQEPTQELSDERKKLAKRLQRVTFWFTGEYVKELANKEKEDAAVKAMQAEPDDGQIKCMVLTAENNAKVMLECIKELVQAVDILTDREEDVDDWMLAGITAMLDKCNEQKVIPFDLPTSICGLLGAEWRK